MIDINKYVGLLIKLKITPNQFLWTYLNMIKEYPLLYSYINAVGYPETEEVDDLIERGLVMNLNKGDTMHADHLVVTDTFAKHFITVDVQQANEFWKKYPDIILVNGKKFKTKTINREQFLMEYQRDINYNENVHKKALRCLEVDIGKGLINTKIDKYTAGKPWEDFEEDSIKPQSNMI